MIVQQKNARLCAAITAGALLVSGCQNMNDTSTTQLQGAGGGAAVGAIIGAVFGGARGAAIGAAAGGALGLGVGSAVAERKRQYADAESFYDAQIRLTQTKNRQLAQYNEGLSREITAYDREIVMLQNQVRAGNADQQAASRVQEQIQAAYAESVKMLNADRRELSAQQQVAAEIRQSKGQQGRQAQQESEQIAALSSHISVLQGQVETMASQSNQLQQFR